MEGRVFNEKLLCTTPIHILICNILSFKEESSVCVHICLFSYRFQFCEECAEVWSGVFNGRLFVPSANLQGELWEQLHVVNASENRGVHVEGKPGIT